MLQTTRERLPYESTVRAMQDARCSVCHVLIRETARAGEITYVVDLLRNTRMCIECDRGES